jgi:putative membrane protein
MEELVKLKYVYAALAYSGLGIVILGVAFTLFDILTPKFSIWKELIEKQNIAVAIFLASLMVSLAIIISSAVHG